MIIMHIQRRVLTFLMKSLWYMVCCQGLVKFMFWDWCAIVLHKKRVYRKIPLITVSYILWFNYKSWESISKIYILNVITWIVVEIVFYIDWYQCAKSWFIVERVLALLSVALFFIFKDHLLSRLMVELLHIVIVKSWMA